jgi:hypothetical protein
MRQSFSTLLSDASTKADNIVFQQPIAKTARPTGKKPGPLTPAAAGAITNNGAEIRLDARNNE